MTKEQDCRRRDELVVLGMIATGLVLIILAIVIGLFVDNNGLPNWAENVLVSVATASALKLGDAINALVALANGRSVENFGTKLAESQPLEQAPVPKNAKDAAEQVANAAEAEATRIGENDATSDRPAGASPAPAQGHGATSPGYTPTPTESPWPFARTGVGEEG